MQPMRNLKVVRCDEAALRLGTVTLFYFDVCELLFIRLSDGDIWSCALPYY